MTGIVVAVDEQSARVRVKFPDLDELVSDWLPVMQEFCVGNQAYRLPDIDTQVVCLMDARLEAGTVLGAIYSDADPPPVADIDLYYRRFLDGTIIQYDRQNHRLLADVKGEVELIATGNTTATIGGTLVAEVTGETTVTTPKCTINGDVVINGTLDTSGKITGGADIQAAVNVADQGGAKTMAGMRQTFNTHTHNHPGDGQTIPQPGTGM